MDFLTFFQLWKCSDGVRNKLFSEYLFYYSPRCSKFPHLPLNLLLWGEEWWKKKKTTQDWKGICLVVRIWEKNPDKRFTFAALSSKSTTSVPVRYLSSLSVSFSGWLTKKAIYLQAWFPSPSWIFITVQPLQYINKMCWAGKYSKGRRNYFMQDTVSAIFPVKYLK